MSEVCARFIVVRKKGIPMRKPRMTKTERAFYSATVLRMKAGKPVHPAMRGLWLRLQTEKTF
jgi:hypothetical protein